jgi:hypothetical protein
MCLFPFVILVTMTRVRVRVTGVRNETRPRGGISWVLYTFPSPFEIQASSLAQRPSPSLLR